MSSRINIWIAASDGNLNYVKSQIESGKHTANDKDPNGYTPLHAAASYGHLTLLQYLLDEAKGDINICDNDGDSILHTVEDLDTAKLLVEKYNANWRIKNEEGQTPLAKLEEEEEFPELIAYFRLLAGESLSGSDNNNNSNSSNDNNINQIDTATNDTTTTTASSLIDSLYSENPNVRLTYERMNIDDNSEEGKGSLNETNKPNNENENENDEFKIDEDQRKQIETIINGENAEENLTKFMQKLVEKNLRAQQQQTNNNNSINDSPSRSEKKTKF